MGRKKKVTYPVKRTPPKAAVPVPGDTQPVRSSVVTIDLTAMAGREGLKTGQRVRILGSGVYSGEIAVIEQFAGGVVPAAVVRTEAGRTRQVRTIDLERVGLES